MKPITTLGAPLCVLAVVWPDLPAWAGQTIVAVAAIFTGSFIENFLDGLVSFLVSMLLWLAMKFLPDLWE